MVLPTLDNLPKTSLSGKILQIYIYCTQFNVKRGSQALYKTVEFVLPDFEL